MEQEKKLVKKDKEEKKEEAKDLRSLSEKIEDGMDDVMGEVQDVLLGEKVSIKHDIPATIETPSGIRKVNKVQTRANLNRRIFGKKGLIILGVIIAVGLVVCLIYYLLNMLLLS